ncbi:MAG: substrate-binding domain-containing protein [Acidobacteriaceae bacterium]|nr:substrate-binding domain-containing protein [Acidobacteriaceae bacterium]MBV9037043.1 substrate-binding domain-containing protein [Acidobacteriaceae bacterium]
MIRSVVQASQVLLVFQSSSQSLSFQDVVAMTAIPRNACNRLLYTLQECGLIESAGEHRYRLSAGSRPAKRMRIGYGSQGQDCSFSRAVLKSLQLAAEQNAIELLVVDNRYAAKAALRNAEKLARERIDLAIEFQSNEAIAGEVAGKFRSQNVPMIAVDIPHPGAIYFGTDNYQGGLLAGRELGSWTKRHWGGTADRLLLVGMTRAGWCVRTRLRGLEDGIKESLGSSAPPITALDGDGQFEISLNAVRQYLRSAKDQRILVAAANDSSALGVLRAFEEAGRSNQCAVIGYNGEWDARAELREPRTRLIGSIALFPEQYGPKLIRLASDMLANRPVSSAYFVKHSFITSENVDRFYPNDHLL